MAAIANVKVIESMIEVPAVSVRKVNRPARVGDLVKAMYEGLDIKCGAFYEVIDVNSRSFFFIDDVGDKRERKLDASHFEVYEKVEVKPESDDLFTYEGPDGTSVQYRKVKRKATVGERILIVAIASESRKLGNVSVGEVFTAKTVDSSGDVWEAAEREFPGIISENWEGLREYVVLEPVKSAEPPKPAYLTIGDYAKVVRDDCGHGYEVGTFVKIVVDDGHYEGLPYKAEKADGTRGGWMYVDDVVPATKAEYDAAVEAEAERAKWAAIGRKVGEYKRGDVVMITGNTNHSVNSVGDTGTISEGPSLGGNYRVNAGNGETSNWTKPNEMKLIAPVEQRFDRTEAVS